MKTGLSLVINIQQYEYTSQVGSTAGIVVLPLDQKIMPFPEDYGLLVNPGYETSIGLTTVRCRMHYQRNTLSNLSDCSCQFDQSVIVGATLCL